MIRILACVLATLALGSAASAETVTPVFDDLLANAPGKSLVAVEVDYPPADASPPHRHPPTAFVFAYVLQGHVRSAVDGIPPRVFGPGESWAEPPGAHHTVSENASRTEPARLLAVFVVDTGDRPLVRPEPAQP